MEDNDKLILYSTGCPKCRILKKKLEEKGLAYSEHNSIDEMLSLGIKAAPALEVDGKVLNFAEANRWIMQQ